LVAGVVGARDRDDVERMVELAVAAAVEPVLFASADADSTAAKATELGGKVIVAPFDAPWSTPTYTIRLTVIADPQGATFSASRFIANNDLRR
jgi:uncharacterized protein